MFVSKVIYLMVRHTFELLLELLLINLLHILVCYADHIISAQLSFQENPHTQKEKKNYFSFHNAGKLKKDG